MIPQLVRRLAKQRGKTQEEARNLVLEADPLDLVLYLEQVWAVATDPPPAPAPPNSARIELAKMAAFRDCDPAVAPPLPPLVPPYPTRPFRAWDHLGASYVLENTRVVQIMRRVVRAFRSGDSIGVPDKPEILRWLNTAEALLWGSANPFSAWLSTNPPGTDGESERRNAYWRLFGLDLSFGTDDNRPPIYDKPRDANTGFVPLFEELLFELWQAIMNLRNLVGANSADDDRIYRLTEALQQMLSARRQGLLHGSILAREELAAATLLGWLELTLSENTPIITCAGADATSPAARLANLGAKVGLAPHSKAAAMFSMSTELSAILKTIESGIIKDSTYSWVLYRTTSIQPGVDALGNESRRVITEWAAASGKELKTRGKPVETTTQRRLVAVQ